MGESEDKGYTVKDRRYLNLSEEEKAEIRKQEAAAQQAAAEAAQGGPETPLPEITFSFFLFSLSSSAFTHLGVIADPESGQVKKNLPLAKQTIDLLALLREKTRNNLTTEEENLFDSILYDLRMQYVKETG
jgi:hypothetical protein